MNSQKVLQIRNIAIIAHVDHGKTTLLDGLLKQSKTFRENEALMTQELIMDSNDQERERGITIVAKNTAISYNGYKINIIDTPGHSDFGGEVERTLNMADGALLLVDAQEGPMPQTKFVLKKALAMGLKVIVVINKIDKKDARVIEVEHKVSNLFLELATKDEQLDFPIYYAIGRDGKAWQTMPADFNEKADLAPIFESIIKYIPSPKVDASLPFQMLITSLDWDNFKGKYSVGRINRGVVKPLQEVVLLGANGALEKAIVDKVFLNQGLKKIEVSEAFAGDICAITGIKNATIGDTLCNVSAPEALPRINIEEPTLKMYIGPNTSPFMGKEGQFVTGRQLLDRIKKELATNIALKFEITESGKYVISGRGELHLSVFIETLRREGFELEVGKPQVITKKIDGVEVEPVEELTVDVDTAYVGAITSEVGRRRGVLLSQEETHGMTRLTFEITTRGLIGLRGTALTLSKGTAVISSLFTRYDKMGSTGQKLRKGVVIASDNGVATSYGLAVAQDKGTTFIGPQTQVYVGMIVGTNARDEDMEVNVAREKKLSNVRSVGETAVMISPHLNMSLEQCLGFLEDDELLEVTPKSLRLRKKVLDSTKRYRSSKN